MAKPIGRIWLNENCMSGYLIVQVSDEFEPVVCKFGSKIPDVNGTPTWLYPPKSQDDSENGHEEIVLPSA